MCVYCAIGQRASGVAKAVAILRKGRDGSHRGCRDARATTRPSHLHRPLRRDQRSRNIFMEAGRDVLIVYDDLTQHARAYRALSLLLVGHRDAKPSPATSSTSTRACSNGPPTCARSSAAGRSPRCPSSRPKHKTSPPTFPPTSSPLPTGRSTSRRRWSARGVLPAVDVGKSVSRVGGKAQRAAYRAVAGDLKLAYAQFEELETFVRFGPRPDEATRKIIEHGRRIRACLKQSELAPVPRARTNRHPSGFNGRPLRSGAA